MAEEQIVNPVGKVHNLVEVKSLVDAKVQEWSEKKAEEKAQRKWWHFLCFWKKGTPLYTAVKFVIMALDELIEKVDELIDYGPDKKATVLAAIEILYDYVIREAVPIWMRPFAGKVKDVIINVVISTAIDWIVAKYREGIWKKPQEETGNTLSNEEAQGGETNQEDGKEEERQQV